MAAAGTSGAIGCPWPPSTAILLATSPSSSDTTRMSSTTDSPLPASTSAITSAMLNGSARRLPGARCPCPSPFPPASAATTSVLPPLASACPPLSHLSPVPAAAPFLLCRPAARGPSLRTVSGLSGDEGDDTSSDVPEDAGEGGCGAASACMQATWTLTPTSPGPLYPPLPAAAAQLPLLAAGWAHACETSFYTHGIAPEP